MELNSSKREEKRMFKKVVACMLASAMCLSMVGCAGTSDTQTNESQGTQETQVNETEEKVKIGYISPGPDTWYLRAEEGAKWAAKIAGAEIITVNSNRDSEQEQTNIDYLIDEGVDAIVILSWNEAGCVAAAEKAKEAGIECVVFDACGVMKNHDVDITSSVDFDWQSMGGTYVEWIHENYPGEDYVFISGTMDSVVCQTVESSLKEATEKYSDMNLADIRYGQYDPEVAANEIEDLVNSGLEFSVIGVINEDCAAAIITRLEDLGVADQYHVFAQNGSDTGVALMKEGSLEFTIASSPGLEGAVATFDAIYAATNDVEANRFISCPIASVLPEDVDDPEIVISWSVDEEAWKSLIETNFKDYAGFFK
jgi:ABC-type sugar transport system substrate-binding protein